MPEGELRTWGEAKGWTDITGVMQSARHLETMVGAPAEQVVRLPQGGLDPSTDAGREMFQRLGMPVNAADYDLGVPEGGQLDESYGAWARETFHKLGLTKDQAQKLGAAHNEFIAGQDQAFEDSATLDVQAGEQQLQREWGNGMPGELMKGKAAIQALGLTGEMVDGIEEAIGYAETMKWAAKIGGRLGEDSFVNNEGGDGAFNTGMTPEKAKQLWTTKMGDENFVKALTDRMHPNHKSAMKEKADLFKVIYPSG